MATSAPSKRLPASTTMPGKEFLARLALIGAVVTATLLAFVLVRQPGRTEFDRRRAQAERLEAQAASAEKQELIVSPSNWIHHEWTVDRSSRTINSWVWSGGGEPSTDGPVEASFVYTEDTTLMGSSKVEGTSSSEPTWYLVETDPMTQGAFESHIGSPWTFLDEHSDPAPRLVGTEVIDGVQLDRFDVFIPPEKFEWPGWVRIGDIGWGGVEQAYGIEASFWFAPGGELHQFIVTSESYDGLYAYEYSSRLASSPVSLEVPEAPRSWAEFEATSAD